MAKAVTQYQKALYVHWHHLYKDIWEVAVGETVVCMLEPGNFHDRNAITVEKDEESLAICHGRYHVSVLFF